MVFKKFSVIFELIRIKIEPRRAKKSLKKVTTTQLRFRSSEVKVIILILISIFGQMDN